MLELLSPAGSPEGVVAAVQNGADAVYMGFGDFNARRNAKNFSEEEFAKAAEYCRVRGVKTYVTLNTLVSDRELPRAAEQAKIACRLGADAVLVQDLGVLLAVRQAVPDLPVHASTQMTIHNLEGALVAAAMGVRRIVLARELSGEEIAEICSKAPVEVEVFVHGALCMSYSGQCYMSAVIGRRSGNRGLCAQPCRLNYSTGGHDANYMLSLKDNCLIHHLQALDEMGVTSVKIEGRMKRPEYAAIVTGIYSKAIREGKPPTAEDMAALQTAFSRQGFTDAYYTDRKGVHMLGVREESNAGDSAIFSTARKNYLNGEFQRVPVRFAGVIRRDAPAKLAARDDRGNLASTEGSVPSPAFHKELTQTRLQTQLYKTGGTPFYCIGVKSEIDSGLTLPVAAVNEMRRDLLADLMDKRRYLAPRTEGKFESGYRLLNSTETPVLTVSVLKAEQLSRGMAGLAPYVLYIPLEEIPKGKSALAPFLENEDITVAAILPRVIHDNEKKQVEELLQQAGQMGVKDVLVGNIGHIQFVRSLGFQVRGDFGLNVFNSQTLRALKGMGLVSATLSFELRLEQVRDLSKTVNSELIVYGRLPLMITESCIIKNSAGVCACDNFSFLKDRTGAAFPVVRAFGCRNVVLNANKLFLADKMSDYIGLGLWGVRLLFTTENAVECVNVMKRYLALGEYEPGGYTRGLYYRGVE